MSTLGLPNNLYRAASVRELDRLAIEEHGIAGGELMARAGRAAFGVMRRRWTGAKVLTVVCGAGNNAGDGYVVARLAAEQGMTVRVAELGDPDRLRGDARDARANLVSAGVSPSAFDAGRLVHADVVVDAVLGTGLDRDVDGPFADAISALNECGVPLLALDIPSGLHADSGRVMGEAVRATATVSFIGLKRGMFTGDGPDRCGRVYFDDLSVPAAIYERVAPDAVLDRVESFSGRLGKRSRNAHKGRFGHVLVVGGDQGYTGAVRMAGEAALRTGAGLVSIATRSAHAQGINAGRPELMVHGAERVADLEALLKRASVVAVGPGLGRSRWAQEMLNVALAAGKPAVVDADGLNLLAESNQLSLAPASVITPHPGEAGRLLGSSAAEVEADRFAALSALVHRFPCASVLKGAGTLVSSPGGGVYVCAHGNPGMATGGMGDVLTGVIAALMAQGLNAEDAARAGVCLHGRAGDLAAGRLERGTLASDLMPRLRALVNAL